jgi:catalase
LRRIIFCKGTGWGHCRNQTRKESADGAAAGAATAGPRGPALLQGVWFLEKLPRFDREVIPERRMHAKGSGACGTFTVTHDITRHTEAKIFSKVGKKTDLFLRFPSVAGGRGAADAESDIRGFAIKLYTARCTVSAATPSASSM